MGKDNRPWRKLVKKLRRKKIRTQLARQRDGPEEDDDDDNDDQEMDELNLQEESYLHKLEEEKWLQREKQAQLTFQMKKAEEERRQKLKEEEEDRIRKEWEELKEKEEKERQDLEKLAEEIRQKQEQEFKEFLDFLSGDIETPPLPYLMPQEDTTTGDICPFFMRTAVCRFGQHCTRSHPRPTLSRIILIPNFFSHFSIEQTLRDEYDTDLNLEYEDSDLYKEFLEFYDDVMPELKRFGDVIQFKVCCNFEPHLRGNVYVQYKDIRQAVEAYRCFNGRFYNGKQLSLQFVKIDSWRSAICGLFSRKRNCPKLKSCNFLHVFRNPTKEFVLADNDWQEKNPPKSIQSITSYSKQTRRERLQETDIQKSYMDNKNSQNNNDKKSTNIKIPVNDNDGNKYSEKTTNYLNTDSSRRRRSTDHYHNPRSDSTSEKRSRTSHSSTKLDSYHHHHHHHSRSRSRESWKLDEYRNKEKDSKSKSVTMKKKKTKSKKKEHKSKKKYSQSTSCTHDDDDRGVRTNKSKKKKHKRSKSKDRRK